MTKAVEDLQASLERHNTRVMNMRAARNRLQELHTRIAYCTTCEQAGPCDVRLMLDVIQGYEDGITWDTNCTHCADMWNDNYAQYERIDVLTRQMKRLGIKPDA